jgi:hypothetical protein
MTSEIARKSCFVVAPYDVAISSFLEALRKERIEPFFISDFLKRGELAISNVRAAFRSVDLVIALLVHGHRLENVFFEIGMAAGLGRPILLFSTSEVDLPSDLRGLKIHRVDLSNPENAIPIIKKWLEPKERAEQADSIGLAAGLPAERSKARMKGAALRDETQRMRNVLAHTADGRQLELELSRFLTEIGWTVVEAKPDARDRAPDLAVWIDEIQKDVGNPLAVEVKTRLTRAQLDQSVSQLSRYLSSAGAKAGLILYNGPELALNKNVAQNYPPIFAFSLAEFANLIEDEKFPAALKSSSEMAKRRA